MQSGVELRGSRRGNCPPNPTPSPTSDLVMHLLPHINYYLYCIDLLSHISYYYYNSLLSFIDKAVDEGFIAPAARHIIVSAQTAQELMCKLEVHFFF